MPLLLTRADLVDHLRQFPTTRPDRVPVCVPYGDAATRAELDGVPLTVAGLLAAAEAGRDLPVEMPAEIVGGWWFSEMRTFAAVPRGFGPPRAVLLRPAAAASTRMAPLARGV